MSKRSFEVTTDCESTRVITTLINLPQELLVILLETAFNRAQFSVCKLWNQLMRQTVRICWWDVLLNEEERDMLLSVMLPCRLINRLTPGIYAFQTLPIVLGGTPSQCYMDKVALLYDNMKLRLDPGEEWYHSLHQRNLLGLINGHVRDLYFNVSFRNGRYEWSGIRSCNFGGTLRPVRQFIRNLFSCEPGQWREPHYGHTWHKIIYGPVDQWPSVYKAFENEYCRSLSLYRTSWLLYSDELRLETVVGVIYERFLPDKSRRLILVGCNTSERYLSRSVYNRQEGRIKYVYNMPDCVFSYHSVELQIQKLLLEKYYGLIVDEMWLLHLSEADGTNLEKFVRYQIEWDPQFMERVERIAMNGTGCVIQET